MYLADPAFWTELQRHTLNCYDEALLRQVAARLVKPRNQWPVEDLIERGVATLENPAVIDRRLRELTPPARRVLALIGLSRQPYWHLGNLVELTLALGHDDGLQPVLELLEAGLMYPSLHRGGDSGNGNGFSDKKIKSFEQWLASPGPMGLRVFAPPTIASRAIGEDLGLPDLSAEEPQIATLHPIQEADGLEWLLRLAVLWQKVHAAPLRRTLNGDFFKRDLERLQQDPLLSAAPADRLADVPDLPFLTVALAELQGVVVQSDGELRSGPLPASWDNGLADALETLWLDLLHLSAWTPLDGWRAGESAAGNPFPSAYLLAFLLLARLPEEATVRPETLERWIVTQHPYWTNESLRPSRQKPWLETFLLGVAYPARLVQARQGQDGWRVRLAPLGRWLLGAGDAPNLEAVPTQTLLVQPNLQILAYRQGLTSSLISRLTQFASWETLGAACMLQLQPETVYRALEAGQSFEDIRLTLEQHGTRALPPAVLDSLRTWANKRDRITVYPSATLLEFTSAEDLNDALARGLKAERLSDRLAAVVNEEDIEYRLFRLAGTRDYALPPEKCVSVEADGVTISIDLARSDLLLETEVPRFAERLDNSASGRRQYRLTPASLSAGRSMGLTLAALETWFHQRAGQPLPAAARLLMTAGQVEAPRLQTHLVLHVAAEELADGLQQWPQTRELIEQRLGPTALVVAEENLTVLSERLHAAGFALTKRIERG